MTTRPINFTADEVRAILDGSMTQFRLVVKPQPSERALCTPTLPGDTVWKVNDNCYRVTNHPHDNPEILSLCPYGVPGDTVFVREPFQAYMPGKQYGTGQDAINRAPMRLYANPIEGECEIEYEADDDGKVRGKKWRHPRYMPRWASRILLELTDVQVVQDDGQWWWSVTFRRIGR